MTTDGRIDASGLDLVALRPYFEARTNVVVTSGALGLKGRLTYESAPSGAARATYAGDISISDFGSLDRPTSQELLRWKSLRLSSVDAVSEPFKLALATVTLDQFYARIIVNPMQRSTSSVCSRRRAWQPTRQRLRRTVGRCPYQRGANSSRQCARRCGTCAVSSTGCVRGETCDEGRAEVGDET